jgi:lipoprotein-releasing system permease protein
MDVRFFIARRLSYKGRVVTAAVAVSFLVVIIAVAVSAGFRREIHNGLSSMTGDVQLTRADMNYLDESSPVKIDQSYLPFIKEVEGVIGIDPVIYRAGIVKQSGDIYGVMVKGVEGGVTAATGAHVCDSISLAVSIPSSLAEQSGLQAGDRLLTYFIGEKVKVRQFNIVDVYEPMVRTDDRHMVYADIADMQRLNGWSEREVSMFEVSLDDAHKEDAAMAAATERIYDVILENMSYEDDMLRPVSSAERFPQIFEWVALIDFNVFFVLILMIAVAAVNMITGLLIMLFENISTIGLLKSLGMRNAGIMNVFLTRAAGTVLKGMLIGNVIAFALCIIQQTTHLITLDPVNYFVSYVPVHLDVAAILQADAVAFVSIMILLVLPSLFVLRIVPSKTIKMD